VIGYIARRLAQSLATLVLAVSLIFIAVRVLPGNPVLSRFGQHVDPRQIERIQREQGWDRPIVTQLGEFFWTVLTTGRLGESLARSNENVAEQLSERVPATI
jgi:peptide/nickel transport system permease protein